VIIDVRRDTGSIETAAFELLSADLAAEYRRQILAKLAGSANAERAVESYETERTLAPGFYGWTIHLFGMEQIRDLGAMRNVSAREAEGLVAIARARSRFRDVHPPCPHCGIPLFDRLVTVCQMCGGKLERRAA
jgi:hypothetical protein